jgi:hypothetical protein
MKKEIKSLKKKIKVNCPDGSFYLLDENGNFEQTKMGDIIYLDDYEEKKLDEVPLVRNWHKYWQELAKRQFKD